MHWLEAYSSSATGSQKPPRAGSTATVSTLRYQIRRVEELTGRDLSSARDRIEFWLALRGSELVHPTTTRPPGD